MMGKNIYAVVTHNFMMSLFRELLARFIVMRIWGSALRARSGAQGSGRISGFLGRDILRTQKLKGDDIMIFSEGIFYHRNSAILEITLWKVRKRVEMLLREG